MYSISMSHDYVCQPRSFVPELPSAADSTESMSADGTGPHPGGPRSEGPSEGHATLLNRRSPRSFHRLVSRLSLGISGAEPALCVDAYLVGGGDLLFVSGGHRGQVGCRQRQDRGCLVGRWASDRLPLGVCCVMTAPFSADMGDS